MASREKRGYDTVDEDALETKRLLDSFFDTPDEILFSSESLNVDVLGFLVK